MFESGSEPHHPSSSSERSVLVSRVVVIKTTFLATLPSDGRIDGVSRVRLLCCNVYTLQKGWWKATTVLDLKKKKKTSSVGQFLIVSNFHFTW